MANTKLQKVYTKPQSYTIIPTEVRLFEQLTGQFSISLMISNMTWWPSVFRLSSFIYLQLRQLAKKIIAIYLKENYLFVMPCKANSQWEKVFNSFFFKNVTGEHL